MFSAPQCWFTIVKTVILPVWAFSLNFLHDFTLFVIDIHQNMSLQSFGTTFEALSKLTFWRLKWVAVLRLRLILPHAPLFSSFPLSPPSQAAPENMLIRAPVKSSFRVYFPDEIRRRRLSHLHYTQSICLGKRLCVILILFGNVVSSLQSLQLYHHGPLLQLVAFFIALHCTAFVNARRTHHWCLGYLILLTFSVLKITNILLYQKEILTMVLALHLVASPWRGYIPSIPCFLDVWLGTLGPMWPKFPDCWEFQ